MAKSRKPTKADLIKRAQELGIELPKRAKKMEIEQLLADAPGPLREMKVLDAVERDLEAIEKLDPELARSGLAASALAVARELDDRSNSATSRSMCAKALIDTLDRLRELAPEPEEGDQLDDLRAKRAARAAAA